ncbi:sialin [Biomphalaria glabrata]|nr:sialin [Biomphalaria glabrata]
MPSMKQQRTGCIQKFCSCRWTLAYMLFLLRICQTALRQSIGMCLVCMVDRTDNNMSSNNQTWNDQIHFQRPGFTLMSNISEPVLIITDESREFEWDSKFQGLVLSSYYYGYLLTPLLASYVERATGAKSLVAISIGFGALINFITPELTRLNKFLLVALRVVAGTTNGMIDPAVQHLWSVWAPKSEIASLCAVEYAGVSVGGIFTFLISGLLCQIPLNNGWPFVFYFYGCGNLLWLLMWFILVYNKPSDHPRISDAELEYIASQTYHSNSTKKKLHPPWLKILTSPAVWALMLASSTYTWVYSWVLCYLPMYMQDVLKYSITENAVLSPLPFVGKFLSGLFCGYLSDRLLRTSLSITANRKMFMMIGSIGCAAVTVAIGFLDYDSRVLAVGLLVLLVTLQNISTVTIRVNVLDIAPRYSGFILAISNTIAVAASLTGPLVTSAVIYEQDNQKQWQTMFYVVASLSLIGGLIFVVLGEAKIQSWADDTRGVNIIEINEFDTKVMPCTDCPHNVITCQHTDQLDEATSHMLHDKSVEIEATLKGHTPQVTRKCSGNEILTT